MYCSSYVHVLLVLLSLAICTGVQSQRCDYKNSVYDQKIAMKDLLRIALMNDSEQLFTLQAAFLAPRPRFSGGMCLNVKVTVKGTVTDVVSDFNHRKLYCDKYIQNNRSCIYETNVGLELIPSYAYVVNLEAFLESYIIAQLLTVLDPSIYRLTKVLSNSDDHDIDDEYYSTVPHYKYYKIQLSICDIELNNLSQMHDDVTDALYITLSWAKAYAKSDGNPTAQTNLEDISWLEDVYQCQMLDSTESGFFTRLTTARLIFSIFVLLNLLILVLSLLYLPKAFSWINSESRNKDLKDLYKASAFVFGIINLVMFITDIVLYFIDDIDYRAYYFIAKLFFGLLIFIVDIILSYYTIVTVKTDNTESDNKCCVNFVGVLALCHILWFMHRVATDIVMFVIVFIIVPAQTLGIIALILLTIVCAILFVSSLLNLRREEGIRSCQSLVQVIKKREIRSYKCIVHILNLGLLSMVTLLFIALVGNGLQAAGLGGFILSATPPTIIFVIGLYVTSDIAIEWLRKVLTNSTTFGSPNSTTPSSSNSDTPGSPINTGNSIKGNVREGTSENPTAANETTLLIPKIEDNK